MVGIFDSGLGGLIVASQFKRRWPGVAMMYLGDTARVPYGNRGREMIGKFSQEGVEFLQQQGVERILIACNTMSAVAMEAISQVARVPVHEVITAGDQKAMELGGRIGLIGTRATVNSGAYASAGVRVACPLLVPLVEEGDLDDELVHLVLQKYLRQLGEVDRLILGCTHYPLLKTAIQKEVGERVTLIDPGLEMVEQVKLDDGRQIDQDKDEFFVTDLTTRYEELSEEFFGKRVRFEKVNLKAGV
jgi:glutamate racemase